MHLTFYKYQGTGNDFIMLDNREGNFAGLSRQQIELLCNRKFGIGADGLILLENMAGADFRMVYYNSDGRQSSMCGNGGRCLVQFAHDLGIGKEEYKFMAVDGCHDAKLSDGLIELKMIDTAKAEKRGTDIFINTGSPHHICQYDNLDELDIIHSARKIRYAQPYKDEGVNVNFVKLIAENHLEMRTYERGVENETLSCGTGVTAAALAFSGSQEGKQHFVVNTRGGRLKVRFISGPQGFSDIWLIGPAEYVFKGEIEI